MRVIPPCFCDGDQVIAVLLHNSFQLLLFVAHAACNGVDALELDYRSHAQHWHATPGLISSGNYQKYQYTFGAILIDLLILKIPVTV